MGILEEELSVGCGGSEGPVGRSGGNSWEALRHTGLNLGNELELEIGNHELPY